MHLLYFLENVLVAGGSSGITRKGEDGKYEISSELLILFLGNKKLSSISSISIPAMPNHNIDSDGAFSVNYRGNLVVGNQNRLYQYKPPENEWSELPSTYPNRHGGRSCCLNNLIVCGGERHGDAAEIFYRYAVYRRKWIFRD